MLSEFNLTKHKVVIIILCIHIVSLQSVINIY